MKILKFVIYICLKEEPRLAWLWYKGALAPFVTWGDTWALGGWGQLYMETLLGFHIRLKESSRFPKV